MRGGGFDRINQHPLRRTPLPPASAAAATAGAGRVMTVG